MIKTDNKILDGVSDVQTEVHQDGDDIILNRVQAIGGILEQNKYDQEGINVMNPSENDRVKMMLKLNSSEYRFLRTAPGHY